MSDAEIVRGYVGMMLLTIAAWGITDCLLELLRMYLWQRLFDRDSEASK
jgi:hypothetical protein